MLTAHLLPGLLTGFGLIVAIGAQNAWVLRQGLARDHDAVIVTICALADLLLVVIGTAGLGALIGDHPAILTGMKWLGAAYLAWFGIRSLWSARHAGALGGGQSPSRSRGSVITTTLALTFLNPHVYLDTLVMLGTVTNSFGDLRWVAAAGAMGASAAWFSLVGLGARALSSTLDRPTTWRVIDGAVAAVMVAIAVRLAVG